MNSSLTFKSRTIGTLLGKSSEMFFCSISAVNTQNNGIQFESSIIYIKYTLLISEFFFITCFCMTSSKETAS